MKSWLKIIKGETEKTSSAIEQEIKGVEKEVEDTQTKAAALRAEFKQAGIQRLAGESTEKTITKLETELRNVERDLGFLEEVKKSLIEKRDAAIERETQARVDEINGEIKKIQIENEKMREEARALGAELAALLWLCYGDDQSTISNLMSMSNDQGIRFRAAVKKATKGQLPFRSQEQALRTERDKLKKG